MSRKKNCLKVKNLLKRIEKKHPKILINNGYYLKCKIKKNCFLKISYTHVAIVL